MDSIEVGVLLLVKWVTTHLTELLFDSATWIEVEPVELARLDVDKQCYLLLLRSKGDPSHQIAIYPVSSTSAYGTLRGSSNDHGTTSRLRLHARRVTSEKNPGALLVVAVSSQDGGGSGSGSLPWRLIQRCVEIGRQWAHQLEGKTYEPTALEEVVSRGPLDNLSFCTWTSLGESESSSALSTESNLFLIQWILTLPRLVLQLPVQLSTTSPLSANHSDPLESPSNPSSSMPVGNP